LIPFYDFFSKFIVKEMTKEEAFEADKKRRATGQIDEGLQQPGGKDFRNLEVGYTTTGMNNA